jgi:hypothetical protein
MKNSIKIYRFFFSVLVFIFIFAGLQGQRKLIIGPTIGFDISRPMMPLIYPGRFGAAASIDFPVRRKLLPFGELGWESTRMDNNGLVYELDGIYGRFGINFNILNNDRIQPHDMILVGFRVAGSYFAQSANAMVQSEYWGDYTFNYPSENLNATWFELNGGIRTELINNVFVGWGIALRLRVSQQESTYMEDYYIPGFGKGSSKIQPGITYSIYYKIPIIREKNVIAN